MTGLEIVKTARLRVISLGAGVQSTTMLLMALAGELTPKPDIAVFADTGWEPPRVYDHLLWLKEQSESGGIPIHIVQGNKGSIRDHALATKDTGGFINLPLYTTSDQSARGMLRRQCTDRFKVAPLQKFVREEFRRRFGERPGPGDVAMWIGISLDEVQRMKASREKWAVKRYPLVEHRISRVACLKWMEDRGFPRPPKSSCVGCPFHNDHHWLEMRENHPAEFADAVAFDKQIRKIGVLKNPTLNAYLHESRKPLGEVTFNGADIPGQGDLFQQECEGMCGV